MLTEHAWFYVETLTWARADYWDSSPSIVSCNSDFISMGSRSRNKKIPIYVHCTPAKHSFIHAPKSMSTESIQAKYDT